MNDAIRMQISAFVDGELPSNEAEMLLRRMSHDAELRQQVADYLETGRMIRGERSIAGMGRLRERIAAAVDEKPLQEGPGDAEHAAPRYVRPLAGVAIAATVALAAIFGLQQTILSSDQAGIADSDNVAAAGVAEETYTVPPDDMLLQYRMSHGATTLDIGATDISARLVSLQSQGVLQDMERGAESVTEPEIDAETADQAHGEESDEPQHAVDEHAL